MPALWVYLFLTAAPLYLANSSAMVFGGKTPIDFHLTWRDGRPIFGMGKTWKGAGMGILVGTFSGFLLHYLFPAFTHGISPEYVTYSFLLSFGAIAGDAIGSFIKRRLNLKSGHPAPLLDQLDFVIGGLVFGLFLYVPTPLEAGILLLITPTLHSLFNRLAFMLKIKSVPW
ncbi:MAG: CDP-2,3-bis-(O-geranylgeranyl)-sn-glycerol synthase [Candidatus Diapherotrites archaeon]|nr:CDP-2,3-bis-(O-geranylgeranyl)-sn-glycerol synthase [Candidatus Diapherotrites archaeon]MDZ4256257.1 CDP-2,3-bis-(O-geranylgeranyl)-sn-glycerol synthase [archaeon]